MEQFPKFNKSPIRGKSTLRVPLEIAKACSGLLFLTGRVLAASNGASKIFGILLLLGIVLSVRTTVHAAAPNPGHNFTAVSGGAVTGDLLYGSATDTLSALADVATGSVLISGGVGVAPSWSALPVLTGNIKINTASLVSTNGIWLDGSNTAGYTERKMGIRGITAGTNNYISFETDFATVMQAGRIAGNARVHLGSGTHFLYPDNSIAYFGTGEDAGIRYSTSQTPDSWQFGVSADSRALMVVEKADLGAFDFAHALQANPTVFIHSANQSTTEWMSFTHDQTNGVIDVGTGVVSIPDGISTTAATISAASGTALNVDTTASQNLLIGELTGATSYVAMSLQNSLAFGTGQADQANFYSSSSDPTLYINNGLNRNISFRIDNVDAMQIAGSNRTVRYYANVNAQDDAKFSFGTGEDAAFRYNTTQTPDSLTLALSADSRALVISQKSVVDTNFDFAHDLQTNPTVFIHSANSSTTQWIGLTHDASDGVISTGSGDLILSPNSGYVGIGTAAPNKQLHVKTASGNAEIDLQSVESPYWGIYQDDTTNDLRFWNVDNRLTLTEDGNVGIGTTSPLKLLDVAGSSRIKGTATSVLTGSIDPAASTTVTGVGTAFTTESVVGDRITVTGETRTITAIASDTSLTVDTAFTDNANDTTPDKLAAEFIVKDSSDNIDFIVQDSGNVGIGTTSPGLKTHIVGSLGWPASSGSTQTGVLRLNGAGSSVSLDFSVNGASGASLQVANSDSLAASYPLILNPNGGNVGIGTTSPGANLEVAGNVLLSGGSRYIRWTDSGGTDKGYIGDAAQFITTPTQSADDTIGIRGDARIVFGISSSEKMRLDTTGLGIGTASPAVLLDVIGDANGAVRIASNLTDATAKYLNLLSTQYTNAEGLYRVIGSEATSGVNAVEIGGGYAGYDAATTIKLFTASATNTDAGTERMTIDSSGKVGIGTTSPSNLLNISGNGLVFLDLDSYGGGAGSAPFFRTRSAQGTQSSPTASLSGDFIGGLVGTGYTGSTFRTTQVDMRYFAAENWSATNMGTYIAFRTTPTGSTTATEVVRIDSSGKVGIGDSTPDYGLDVVADINSDDCFREAGVQVAGTCASDIRLKKNIHPLNGSLNKIMQLKPVEFEWKEGIEKLGGTIRYVEGRQVGLIAQDVANVLPHLVAEKDGYLSVEYNLEMQMMLINAVQELKVENNKLKKKIEALERK